MWYVVLYILCGVCAAIAEHIVEEDRNKTILVGAAWPFFILVAMFIIIIKKVDE